MQQPTFNVQLRVDDIMVFCGERTLDDVMAAAKLLQNRPTQPTTQQPTQQAAAPAEIQAHTSPEVLDADTLEIEEINGKLRIRLEREHAEDLVELIEHCRKLAANDKRYTQENLDVWDRFWSGDPGTGRGGICDTLSQYAQPRVSLKQLLWCQNSVIKVGHPRPKWFSTAIKRLRKAEQEQ